MAVNFTGVPARQTSWVSSSITMSANSRREPSSTGPWVRRRMARVRATTSASENGLVT